MAHLTLQCRSQFRNHPLINCSRSGLLICCSILSASAWATEGTGQSPAVTNTPPTTVVPERAPSGPDAREVAFTFKELGAFKPLQLGGIDGSDTLGFGLRRDEVVIDARLRLRYTYSPSLIADLSHLKIFLNNEVVATVPLPKEQTGTEQMREITLDARYLSDFNQLRLQLIGHYTMACEDALHSSLWVNISNESRLEFTVQRIALPNELSLLPAPFFDMRDHRKLELPFVFANKPPPDVLHSAGLVASWFGSLVSYREARFPSVFDRLPERNAVVLATSDRPLQGLQLPQIEGPTIMVIPHPGIPEAKLLLLLGRDGAELTQAATALVLGQAALSGQSATVGSVTRPPRRLAYDAPKWLRSDRPVKLGELIEFPEELQVKSRTPKLIQMKISMPPDLLIWRDQGIPLNLNYRYTPPVADDNSTLNIGINNEFIRSLPLRPELQNADQGKVTVPLRDDRKPFDNTELVIPAFQVSSENVLLFQFSFDYHKQGLCRSFQLDNVRASIDPDSTLDVSQFAHYTEMPNLASFVQTGFPFTKYADLAETAVVMPDQPDAFDIETMLTLLGYMGRATGVPAMRFRLLDSASVEGASDADLLLVNASGSHELLDRWRERLPVLIEGDQRTLATEFRVWPPYQLFDSNVVTSPASTGQANFRATGPLAAVVGFESPIHRGRSVVAITATSFDAARSMLDALTDGAKRIRIRGDAAYIRGNAIDSFQLGDRYFVGDLPLWTWASFHASRHPLMLAWMGIMAGVLAAFLIYRTVGRIARRRLKI